MRLRTLLGAVALGGLSLLPALLGSCGKTPEPPRPPLSVGDSLLLHGDPRAPDHTATPGADLPGTPRGNKGLYRGACLGQYL